MSWKVLNNNGCRRWVHLKVALVFVALGGWMGEVESLFRGFWEIRI